MVRGCLNDECLLGREERVKQGLPEVRGRFSVEQWGEAPPQMGDQVVGRQEPAFEANEQPAM